MNPTDKIYNILAEVKQFKQERGYTSNNFNKLQKNLHQLADKFPWNKDDILELVEKKDALFNYKLANKELKGLKSLLIFNYKLINKELKGLKSLLKFINTLLKKKEFIAALESSKIDIEQFKKAIKFNKLKLKVLKDRNKDCKKKMQTFVQTFVKVIKITNNKKEFKKALAECFAECDEAQAKLAYVDRLENSIENGFIVEQSKKVPGSARQRTGIWKTATAYAVVVIIGFGAVTGSYTSGEGISFGGGAAMASELHDKAFYDGLAEEALKMNKSKNYNGVIKLLEKYKMEANNSDLLDELASAYSKTGKMDEAIKLFKQAVKLDSTNTDAYYNLGGIFGYIKKDKTKAIKYFKLYIKYNGANIEKARTHIKRLSQ